MHGFRVAPQVGLEPTTLRLTAECSAIELLRHINWPTDRRYYSKEGASSQGYTGKLTRAGHAADVNFAVAPGGDV